MTSPGALAEIVRLMAQMERRVGKVLFREMLALHFSPEPARRCCPAPTSGRTIPLMTLVVRAIELAGSAARCTRRPTRCAPPSSSCSACTRC